MKRSAIILVCLLAACGRSGSGGGGFALDPVPVTPDEFAVRTNLPLVMPADFATLPAPDPGGPNRVDRDAGAALIAALGGRRTTASGIPSAEMALVNAARRSGTTQNIRGILRAEDAALRTEQAGRLKRLAAKGQAADFYDFMTLNDDTEAARLRAMGVFVPVVALP